MPSHHRTEKGNSNLFLSSPPAKRTISWRADELQRTLHLFNILYTRSPLPTPTQSSQSTDLLGILVDMSSVLTDKEGRK